MIEPTGDDLSRAVVLPQREKSEVLSRRPHLLDIGNGFDLLDESGRDEFDFLRRMRVAIRFNLRLTEAGTHMLITSGKVLHPIRGIAEGARGTWFLAPSDPVAARKRWIAGTLEPKGTLVIDAGAAAALQQGRSLLPAGVRATEGEFDRGDAVSIRDQNGRVLGRGLSAYARRDVERIMGKKSSEIAAVLGFEGRAEVVHRDDMALARG